MSQGLEALSGKDRISLIIEMAPKGRRCVDVGADHGHVAAALGAVASEREPHRLPRRTDVARTVADGLRGHRDVELAILTGMGPRLILRILDEAPRPQELIAHSPQHSHVLRAGLAARGWRVHQEGLAPENGRLAEVLHLRPGESPHSGYVLEFGESLMRHPWGKQHAAQVQSGWSRLAADAPSETEAHQRALGWIDWLEKHMSLFPG